MPKSQKSNHPSPQLTDYLVTHDQHEASRGSQHAPSSDRQQGMAQHLHAWDTDWARMSDQKKEDTPGLNKTQEGK